MGTGDRKLFLTTRCADTFRTAKERTMGMCPRPEVFRLGMKRRLRFAMSHRDVHQAALAKRFEITPGAVSQWLSEDELAMLLRQLRTHLDDQTQVSRQTVAGIDRLAQTAEALNRLDRNAGQLVAMATEHVGVEESRSADTSQALTAIRETSQHHTEILGLMQQQLDTNARTLDRVADTLDHIQRGVASVAAASDQTAELLARLDRVDADGAQAMRDFLARTQRSTLVVLAGCASASILAVVVAILALVQQGGG